MAVRTAETLLTTLGFTRQTSRLYERMLTLPGRTLPQILAALAYDYTAVEPHLRPLIAAGIVVEETDGTLTVRAPAEAVALVLADAVGNATRNAEMLQQVSRALPYLAGSTLRLSSGPEAETEDQPLDGEVVVTPFSADAHARLLSGSGGDVLWLRPDQWATPLEEATSTLITEIVSRGRRARSIYPIRALTEAPGVIAHRAELGEEIRFQAHVPTRMVVIGADHAIIPEPIGYAEAPRLTLRQRGIVEVLTLLFEAYWARAEPYDPSGRAMADAQRRFLLQQLATGAQDEQIARRLGVSLRTVRRRVAELLDDLGVDSRFAAGVEAARRGWV